MSTVLARAMLKEIPLAKIEVYLQVLDSGVLKGRAAEVADNGDWCGGGCDAKGGACGAWCAFPEASPEQIWGSFDQHGHLDISAEDFHAVIANPSAMRKALLEELQAAAGAIGKGEARLGPKIDPNVFIRRGQPQR
jgi:hypothetical protein